MKDIMSNRGAFTSRKISRASGADDDINTSIWTTIRINKILEEMDNGLEIKGLHNSPFKDNDINLKRANLPFEYTPEEWEELSKCKEDILYFAYNYCHIQTGDGVKLLKDTKLGLRDYQEEILNAFVENRYTILMASRQLGKCLDFNTQLEINGSTITIGELYYNEIIKTRELTIIEKLKLKLYSKIKGSRKNTLKYKLIEFLEKIEYFDLILDETNIDFKILSARVFKDDVYVKTDSGKSKVASVNLTQPYTKYSMYLENGLYLDCADTHIVFDSNMNQVYIKDLNIGDFIQTENGPIKVSKIEKSNIKVSMFDISLIDGEHRYYSNGILSHNTVTSAIYMLWYLLFNAEKTALVVADNFTTTRELLDKFRIGLDNLPFFMKPGIKNINTGSIKFDNDSRIVGRTTTKKSGIGLSVNLLYMDEFAHIDEANLDSFYKAILPTITADPNSKVIITSTPNGKNKFYEIWSDAISGKSEYVPIRVDWWQVPGRDEAWKQKTIANLGSVEDFNQEYGLQFFSSDQLLLTSTDLKRLYNIKTDYRNSKLTVDEDHYYINENFYVHPKYHNYSISDFKNDPGKYVFSVDTADGVGGDYSVLNIYKVVCLPIKELMKKKEAIRSEMDTVSLIQVAYFRSNELDINVFSAAVDFIAYKVFNPENIRIVLEMNHKGEVVHNRINTNSDYWIGQMVHTKHTEMAVAPKLGLRLGNTNKIKYCERFKYLISINRIIPNDYLAVMELMAFGKSKGGTYRGQNGNDDIAMTCVNLSPFFESTQFWDLAIETFELMPEEYRNELNEKIFNVIRESQNSRSMYDYKQLSSLNEPSQPFDQTRQVKPDVFNPETINQYKQITSKFFKK